MKKKAVIILLAFSLIGSLVGCGNGSPKGTDSSVTQSEDTSQNEKAENTSADTTSSSDSYIKPAYAETENGWLYGYQDDSTYIFKGIQYGVVTERFMPAEKPEAWQGIKSALVYGETAPNGNDTVSVSSFVDNFDSDMVQNEQCLFLNVWTQSLDTSAKKPVVVFLHGGGFTSGASNELACYDGKNISEYGDVVYVDLNHRLNYLGYTDLSAYGDEYALSGDVGMQDIIMALQWVQDNIANFGGDASNVTIVGQSGGGVKVALLLQAPSASGLFQKAMICSGTGLGVGLTFGTPAETTKAAGVQLVEKCKSVYNISDDQEAIKKLQEISYEDLSLLCKDIEGGIANSPAVNNDFVPEVYDSENSPEWPEIAKDIPLIVSNTFGELTADDGALTVPMVINNFVGQTFDPSNPDAFLANCYKPNMTEDDMVNIVKAKFGDASDKVMELFAKAYPSRDVIDVDSLNRARQASVDLCKAKADQGGAPVYNCVFSYEYPIMGGIMNYHTGGDLPFLFHNLSTREFMIKGDEDTAHYVEDEAASALVNFAYTGDPSTKDVEWPAFTTETGETMIFDDKTEVINYPDQELISVMNEALGEPTGW